MASPHSSWALKKMPMGASWSPRPLQNGDQLGPSKKQLLRPNLDANDHFLGIRVGALLGPPKIAHYWISLFKYPFLNRHPIVGELRGVQVGRPKRSPKKWSVTPRAPKTPPPKWRPTWTSKNKCLEAKLASMLEERLGAPCPAQDR